MTLRNASLTAVAALTVALAGGAVAQDATTAPGTTAPAGSSYQTTPAAPAAETPAQSAPAVTEPAAEPEAAEPEATEPAAAEPAAEPAAEAPAAAETAPAEAEKPAAEAPAPAAEPAAEPAAPAEAPAAAEAPAPAEPAAEPAAPAEASAAEPAAAPEAPAAETPAEPAPEAEAAAEPAAEPAPAAAHKEAAPAAHAAPHIEDISFSFEGPFGKYDQFQLQRGLQVYTEVCAACHGLRYVPIRTLHDDGGPALPEDQVRAYAANLTIVDAETGEERPRTPTDHFPTVHGDGMGPDLSLMAKARAAFHGPYGTGITQLVRGIGGPEYIHAILTGFNGEEKEEAGSTFYHNAAFSTGWIKMPPPLSDGQVTYEDGTEATVDQMSRDVAAFLMWTAEPKMMDRKQVGFVSVLFLIALSVLLYLTNKKLWWPIKHPRKPE